MNSRGFTLLEVLVAVSITALIGVGAAQLLKNVSDSKQSLDIRSQQLASLQRFNNVISRDAEQFISRKIRDNYGNESASLLLDDGDYAVEFTHAGWRNRRLSKDPRSTLRRVAYSVEAIDSDACERARLTLESWGVVDPEDDCLIRYYWHVLDRSSDSEPVSQVVLEQISNLEIDVLVEKRSQQSGQSPKIEGKDWFSSWPSFQNGGAQGNSEIPVALRWRFNLPQFGDLERVWLIAYDEE